MEFLDGFGGEVVEVFVRALGVEPQDPLGGGQFDVVDVAPGDCRRMSSFLNDPTVVSASALSRASPTDPTEGSTPSSRSRRSERHRGVLTARIVVRNQAVQVGVALLGAGEEGVLDSIENQRGGHRSGCTPAHDPATERIDDERDVDEPAPRRHIGEVGHPQPIWRRSTEVAVDQVRVPQMGIVTDRGLVLRTRNGHPPNPARA